MGPSWGVLGRLRVSSDVLGRLQGVLGTSWGRLGGVLETSWGRFGMLGGRLWEHDGAPWGGLERPQGSLGASGRKAMKHKKYWKTIGFTAFESHLGVVGVS